MNNGCAQFRAELAEALAGLEERRAALARHAHVAECAGCRSELRREQRLEHALALVSEPEAPRDLARNVLAQLGPARGAAQEELERLLARIPPPHVPAGLAEDVLAGLAPARSVRGSRAPWAWLVALAAGLLILWGLLPRRNEPDEIREELARAALELEADEDLLVYALERWELLHDEDLDLWLASLDPVDEALMEVAEDDLWLDEPPAREGN